MNITRLSSACAAKSSNKLSVSSQQHSVVASCTAVVLFSVVAVCWLCCTARPMCICARDYVIISFVAVSCPVAYLGFQ